MKKVLSMFLILILLFTFSSCGKIAYVVGIEDYEWKMRAVMKNDVELAQDEKSLVIAVGEVDD